LGNWLTVKSQDTGRKRGEKQEEVQSQKRRVRPCELWEAMRRALE
jgi:hypothetical protein